MIDLPIGSFLSTFLVVFVLSVPIFALFSAHSPVRQGTDFLSEFVIVIGNAFIVALVAAVAYTLSIMLGIQP